MLKKTSIPLILCFVFIVPALSASGYYINVKSSLEMRLVVKNADDSDSVKMNDLNGMSHIVEADAIVKSHDIHGVSIEKDEIAIYIDRAFWRKVREITSRNYKRKLAIVKDNVIINKATLMGVLTRSVRIVNTDDINLNWFLRGFKEGEKPHYFDSNKAYIEFLSSWLRDYPDDFETTATLAWMLTNDPEKPEWEEAVPLYKKLINWYPEGWYYFSLAECFVALGQYQEAIQTIRSAIEGSDKREVWIGYYTLGNIFQIVGDTQNALGSFEKALELLRDTQIPWQGAPPDIFRVLDTLSLKRPPGKEELIKDLESKIDKLNKS